MGGDHHDGRAAWERDNYGGMRTRCKDLADKRQDSSMHKDGRFEHTVDRAEETLMVLNGKGVI
eukprot:8526597-Heterocapsa_arctica.AAC.1